MAPHSSVHNPPRLRLVDPDAEQQARRATASVRLVLVLEYVRAGMHVEVARPLIRQYAAGFTVALGLWLASTAVATPGRYWFWVVAMVVDLGTPSPPAATRAPCPRSLATCRNGSGCSW